MKKILMLFYLSVFLSLGAGVIKAAWDTYADNIIANINIGNINTVSYNVTKDTSIENDLTELGFSSNGYSTDVIGGYLLKNNSEYDLILYFQSCYMIDSDVFTISINNSKYYLDYTEDFNNCYLSSSYYYTCEHNHYNFKKIYIRNVGNIDSLKVIEINYYFEEEDDNGDYFINDEIITINKTINLIKGF